MLSLLVLKYEICILLIISHVHLGFLDLSSESEDLKIGTKLELPLWLAQPLNIARESIVSVDIPKTYKEGYRCIFKSL